MKNTIQKSALSTNLVALVFVLCGVQLHAQDDDASLINVTTLDQLNAIRYDLDGNGSPTTAGMTEYASAFGTVTCIGGCKGYELINDLDFKVASSYASSTINMDWTTGSGWEPIGVEDNEFTTTFEGNGQTISNLFIDRSSNNVGLFGYVIRSSAELRNIGLLEVKVTGYYYVGGLVGSNDGGMVSNSYATGSVTGNYNVGGLVGNNFNGTVSNSYATGSVTGDSYVGGLVGGNESSVSGSYATGAVTGSSEVGGLVGNNFNGTVSNNYATGAVTADSEVGGLVGSNSSGTITASYYNRQTTGQSDINKGEGKATAELLAPTGYTGIYGEWDDVTDDWDFGTNGQYPVLKIDVDGNGSVEAADLLAQRPLRFRQTSYAFAILNTASINDVVGIVRAVPKDANNELTYSIMGTSTEFSITVEAETGNPSKVGQISVKANLSPNTYTLNVEVTETGGGTATVEVRIKVGLPLDADEDGLIEVSTLEQLNAIRYDLDGNGEDITNEVAYSAAFGARIPVGIIRGYELMNNLDFARSRWGEGASGGDAVGGGWEPIGDNSTSSNDSRFTAIFEGNGHTISNLFIDRSSTSYVGLFGSVSGSTAELRNIGLLEVKVTGDSEVGGLAGWHYQGTVSNSYATGSVTGSDFTGGLVGLNEEGTVSGSYATGSVRGTNQVGGLVGQNSSGTVSGNYATGAVRGVGNVGGLVGRSNSSVSGSYATGSVRGDYSVGGLVGSSLGDIVSSYATGSVTGDDNVGGLVGRSDSSVSGSYATGSVTGGDENIGGLVGWNQGGTVSSSYATGAVTGTIRVGGLVGRNDGSVSGSYATGSVRGTNRVGGLVGVSSGDIVSSYATGSVTGGDENIGGLVGYDFGGTVTASYYNRQTTGQNDTGKGESKTTAELLTPTGYMGIYTTWDDGSDDTSSADDTDYWDFGTNGQYPVLKLDVDGSGTAGEADDLLAQRPLRFRQTSYTFAILNTASINDVVGIVRAVPKDANNELTYSMGTSTEFSITVEAEMDNPSKVGQISVKTTLSTNTYTLNVDVMEAGGGTATVEVRIKVGPPLDTDEDGLIEVSTLEQLNAIRYDLDGDGTPTAAGMTEYTTAFEMGVCTGCTGYELMNNLDFARSRWEEGASGGDKVTKGWEPIGDNSTNDTDSRFTAIFEGNGHTISNLFINRPSTNNVGLFGYVRGSSARLRNIGLLEVNVRGNSEVGGLVGINWDSTVSNSYATGSVRADSEVGGLVGSSLGDIVSSYATGSVTGNNDSVGGLVGRNDSGRMVSNSYATGAVSGVGNVGGLVGRNDGTVSGSYATGSVTGTNRIGGLVGEVGGGSISDSYATGLVTGVNQVGGLVGVISGTITASYYNSETTGQSDMGKGEGKTTAELLAPTGYTGIYATWGGGGTDDWDFGTNGQYPVLKIDVDGNGIAGEPADLARQRSASLNVDPTSLHFTAMGGDMEFTIIHNAVWTAEVSTGDSWLTLDMTSGGSGTTTLRATAVENVASVTRMGTLTITAGTLTQTVNVTQEAVGTTPTPTLTVSETTLIFVATGEGKDFTITTTEDWTAEVSVGDSWLTLSSGSGSGGMTITATVQENLGAERMATVTITSGTLTQTVNVTQEAVGTTPTPTLTVSETTLIFVATGEGKDFTITTTEDWTAEVSVGDSWLTLSSGSGSGGMTITATVQENLGAERMATVTITSGTLTQTVNVTQVAVGTTPTPTLTVSETTLIFVATGEGKDFTITTTEDWTAEVSAGDSWLTLDSDSGNANMTITATAQQNLGTERMATITITSGTLTQTVNVTQGAGTQTVLLAVPVIPTSMRVYPNPTSGQLRFTGLSSDQRYTYGLYSLVAQKIRSGQISGGKHIDLGDNFPEGQYILVLQTEEGRELLRSRVQVVK